MRTHEEVHGVESAVYEPRLGLLDVHHSVGALHESTADTTHTH